MEELEAANLIASSGPEPPASWSLMPPMEKASGPSESKGSWKSDINSDF